MSVLRVHLNKRLLKRGFLLGIILRIKVIVIFESHHTTFDDEAHLSF